MSDNGVYSTGWYSVSPAFAGWNSDVHRLAAIKARREAERIAEEDKKQKDLKASRDLEKKRQRQEIEEARKQL